MERERKQRKHLQHLTAFKHTIHGDKCTVSEASSAAGWPGGSVINIWANPVFIRGSGNGVSKQAQQENEAWSQQLRRERTFLAVSLQLTREKTFTFNSTLQHCYTSANLHDILQLNSQQINLKSRFMDLKMTAFFLIHSGNTKHKNKLRKRSSISTSL